MTDSVIKRSFTLFALCLLSIAPSSHGQELQSDGSTSLRVIVTDAEQHSVSGAACSLIRPGPPEVVVASATADEQGAAVFQKIMPGAYTLRVQSKGFEPFTRKDLVIQDSQAAGINVVLVVSSVTESVTIAAPTDEATSVEAGASTPTGNLQRRSLQRLPLATARVDEALPLVPGVVRSSTGEISIKGATEQQSALLVNGLNAADPASGNFRLNLPVDSVESVQVFLHPYKAEYGQFTGGVTRVETRRGSNRWHLEVNDFFPDFRFKGGHLVGVAEDTPRVNFNGPLVKNRLYLSQSLSYTIAKRPVRGLAFPVNETKTESQSYFLQFNLTLNSRHTQTYTFGYFPERDQFVGLDFFRPQPVTPNYKQKDFVFTARDSYSLGGGLLQSSLSVKRFKASVWGQGTGEQTLTPTVEGGNYFNTQDRHSRRFELFEVYEFPSKQFLRGSHEIKVGLDFNSVSNRMNYSARPVNIVRADGTRAERITFDAASSIRESNREYVGFVQDRWMVRHNLSFDLGLRYENQRIANEQNLAPRAGFAWSPFKNDKTIIRGGIGLFFDKVPLNIRAFAQYPSRTVTRYAADGVMIIDSRHFTNVLVDTAPIAPLDFRLSKVDAGFVPENLTWNIQLDQTINSLLALRANFINSHTSNIYVVNPELDFRGQSAIVLRSAGRATYRALELTARFTLPEKQSFYVSYVSSRSRGDLNDFNSYFGDFGAPVIRPNQYSNLPFDAPNRLLAWGTIALPHRVTLSPIFEARSGFPYSVRDEGQNFVGVRNSDQTRFPRFLALDLEIAKEFQVTKKYGVRLSLRGFNLTNHFNPRDVRSNLADPLFGQFLSSYRRYFTGGFDIIF
ncbi:MAG: carboxypeptidase regulatory-like domain-containing protein [Acidobacteriota bacterium]|nr:carboxypeptidase regulatory-like domain-containing protein [Acidobacteriota bacterium]